MIYVWCIYIICIFYNKQIVHKQNWITPTKMMQDCLHKNENTSMNKQIINQPTNQLLHSQLKHYYDSGVSKLLIVY